jgi:signal transduction histidine kinase
MSRFQASLIDTTEMCAHASGHHPDGSRLQQDERVQETPTTHIVKGGVEPLISTDSYVNLAAIAEEVIEGVTTGFLAKSDPSMELGWSGERAKRDAKTFEDLVSMPQSPVEVILDVSPPQDWTFVTQPEAYRRIIMNIFGNSLVRALSMKR